jgi:glycerophosphoryl diester phosphodiesterase
MAAFRLAVDQGADLIEMDVQLCADGVPVVIHDPTVDRTTNGTGLVQRMSLAEIKQLEASAGFPEYEREKIPALDEVLEWASGTVPVVIEIKNTPVPNPGIEARVVELLRAHRMLEQAVVISFDHRAVLRTKELCPELAGGVLFFCSPVRPSTLAIEARADVLLPYLADVDDEMVRDARASGLAIAVWGGDDAQARRALALGLDAIGTDYPGRLRTLLAGTSGS